MARALGELAAVERESDGTTSAAGGGIDRRQLREGAGESPLAPSSTRPDGTSLRSSKSRRLTATKAEVL